MAAVRAAKPHAPRRRWPLAEKRRIVELTLSPDASVREIARAHALHPNVVHQWRRRYRCGKLDSSPLAAPPCASDAEQTRFVPVHVVHAVPQSPAARPPDSATSCSSVVQVMLAEGSTVRVESSAIDASMVCAVIAQLQR